MKAESLLVQEDGTIVTVGDLPVDIEGHVTRKRGSHIFPCGRLKFAAFLALRVLFGDRGRVAAWTRTWRGPWICHIIQTGEYNASASRQKLLEWERLKLEQLLVKQ